MSEKLLAVLRQYADPDNWYSPDGTGFMNTFERGEDGWTIAADALSGGDLALRVELAVGERIAALEAELLAAHKLNRELKAKLTETITI